MIQSLQRLLFDDVGDLRPLRLRIFRKTSKEERTWRQQKRERAEQSQLRLFGPKRPKKPYKPPRHIFSWRIGADDREPSEQEQAIAAIFIAERAALVRRQWSQNKEHKANHYPVNPLIFQPQSVADLHIDIDFKERFE